MTAGSSPSPFSAFAPGCRLHGPACRVRWGYDPAHTDQRHPYTLDQLAERADAPHYYAYPDPAAYEAGFHLWRAIRRDDRPSHDELMAAQAVLVAALDLGLEDALAMPYPDLQAYTVAAIRRATRFAQPARNDDRPGRRP